MAEALNKSQQRGLAHEPRKKIVISNVKNEILLKTLDTYIQKGKLEELDTSKMEAIQTTYIESLSHGIGTTAHRNRFRIEFINGTPAHMKPAVTTDDIMGNSSESETEFTKAMEKIRTSEGENAALKAKIRSLEAEKAKWMAERRPKPSSAEDDELALERNKESSKKQVRAVTSAASDFGDMTDYEGDSDESGDKSPVRKVRKHKEPGNISVLSKLD